MVRQAAGRAFGLSLLCRLVYERQRSVLNTFDIVFFSWPYQIECPDLNVPVAFIPHDFNYVHFFGAVVYSMSEYRNLVESHRRWFAVAHPVVSSRFIARELAVITGRETNNADVIPLSRLSPVDRMADDHAQSIRTRLGVEGDYILCPNNIQYHKNLGGLVSVFHSIAAVYPEVKLVLCGAGTEEIRGVADNDFYIDHCSSKWNVLGLGLVRDEELVALIQSARLVINPSLYEAGNGSGLDAWALGTPVAMSNIPAFVEHLDVLGVRAKLFNPRCCHEMRDAILDILRNPDAAQADAEVSRDAMEKYGWDMVATRYVEFFTKVIERHKHDEVGTEL